MKKLIAFLLILTLSFALCGCAGVAPDSSEEPSSEAPITTVDVLGYASIGRFPEFDVGLGGSMGDVRAQYLGVTTPSYAAVSGMHTLSADSTTYYMTTGDYNVIAILTSKQVMGFSDNVTPDKLAGLLGEPVAAGVPDISKLDPYGNISGGDSWMQTYISGDNTIVFYYLAGKLHSTLIYKTGAFALLGE